MTTLAILTSLLLLPWLVTRILTTSRAKRNLAAVVGVSLLLTLTGSGHFMLAEPMTAMLPPWLPWRLPAVYLSGVLELLLAGLLLVGQLRRNVGWVLIVMLVLFLPVNIYGAVQQVPLAGHEGGLPYLLLRVPLQFLLIGWVYWFAVRGEKIADRE